MPGRVQAEGDAADLTLVKAKGAELLAPGAAFRALEEAIEIIRTLFDGGYVTYRGEHFDVEDAKLFDKPDELPQIGVAVSGRPSCEVAGEQGDFVIAVEPKSELIEMFNEAGGEGKPGVGQIPVC